jgi:hypothetical protein
MRLCLLAAALLLMPSLALAGTREDVLSGTIRCGTIQDDRVWLDCYYGAAQPMRQQLKLMPAPDAQIHLVPQTSGYAAPPPRPVPGAPAMAAVVAPTPQKGRDGILYDVVGGKVLVSKMAAQSYSFDSRGYFTITLSDGEVWRQSPGDDGLAKWDRPATDYLITIRQGAIGSIQLEVRGDSRIYKVKRVR